MCDIQRPTSCARGGSPVLVIKLSKVKELIMKSICVTLLFIFAFSTLADVLERTNEIGETVLMLASASGDIQVVIDYIENGANIEAEDMYGQTALMRSIRARHIHTAIALVEMGANIHAVDKYGKTPFKLIFEKRLDGHPDIQEIRDILSKKNNNAELESKSCQSSLS